uniref:Odorant receptor n=1 Tax=Heliconius melpomene rosina TaxID=171916 RepID=A0A1S5XXM8_HELME|nr:olfactory receptor 26 [Heliconius melpomene rosina]
MRLLQRVGFMRAPGRAREGGYRALVLAVTAAYLLQECVYAYQERSDMSKLSQVMFLLLCHITSIVKQIVFHIDADRIDQLVQSLNDPIYNSTCPRARALLSHTTARARRLQRAYAGCAALTCTLWGMFAAWRRACGGAVEFPFWTGLRNDSPAVFIVILLYSFYVTTLVGLANTTMDAFIATILYQCKTQFTILRTEFETLPERAKSLSIKTNEDYERVIMTLFVKCYHHYQKIIETSTVLGHIFGVAILVQFGIGGWILCMAAYKLVSLNILSIEFASTALFILCILTELFLYCYYGNELTVESDKLVCSVYCMRWQRAPPRLRRLLVLVMERARRPLRPIAARLVPLSLETFLKILKSSYTFYAVLRQTK